MIPLRAILPAKVVKPEKIDMLFRFTRDESLHSEVKLLPVKICIYIL